MEKHGYDKLVKHHMDKREAHRSGKYHQTEIDREHEKMGMEHHSMRGTHDYDRSRKHRERESEGMKRYHRDH